MLKKNETVINLLFFSLKIKKINEAINKTNGRKKIKENELKSLQNTNKNAENDDSSTKIIGTKNIINTKSDNVPKRMFKYFFIKNSSETKELNFIFIPTPALPGSGTVDSNIQSPLSQVNLAPTNYFTLLKININIFLAIQ